MRNLSRRGEGEEWEWGYAVGLRPQPERRLGVGIEALGTLNGPSRQANSSRDELILRPYAGEESPRAPRRREEPEDDMRDPELSFPELMFIVGTRAALAAGVALLFADRLSRSQRRSIGAALVAVGAATTIPAAMALLRR